MKQLLSGNLGSIELTPTILTILVLVVLFYLLCVYMDRRFKKTFGCTWKNIFIFRVGMASKEYINKGNKVTLFNGCKYHLSKYFTLQNDIVFEEGFWFYLGEFNLPFTMFLGIFGRPYLDLDISAKYEVLSKEKKGLELALVREDAFRIDKTKNILSFEKVENPSLGWIYVTRQSKKKFEDIEPGDKVRFIYNKKRELTIEKINN